MISEKREELTETQEIEVKELEKTLYGSTKSLGSTAISEKLAERREAYNPIIEEAFDLKMNTGDWAYQSFAELSEENGFDDELYQKHYDKAAMSEDGRAPRTQYANAMNNPTTIFTG